MHNAPCTMVPFDNLSRLTVVKSFTSLIQFYHRLFSKISTQTAVMNSQVLLFHSSSIFVNLHLWLKCVELFRCYTCLWTQHNSFSTEQWCCLQTIEETLLQWLVIKQKKKKQTRKSFTGSFLWSSETISARSSYFISWALEKDLYQVFLRNKLTSLWRFIMDVWSLSALSSSCMFLLSRIATLRLKAETVPL